MKKIGLTLEEHIEIGRNLRTIKTQINSLQFLMIKKIGITKRCTKMILKSGDLIDKATDNLLEILNKKIPDAPTDTYYKI